MTQLSSACFPVVFFDGDRDIDVGSVAVTPSFDFINFQLLVAQKIGVSPHQISISLVRRKKARYSPEIQRKVPIDESSDFSAISRERDCFVLVVMKRSRSGRRGRGRRGRSAATIGHGERTAIEVPEMTILKRNTEEPIPILKRNTEEPIPIGSPGFWDYETQMRNLQRMRENFLLSTAAYFPYATSPTSPVGGGFPSPPSTPPVCEQCVKAKREGGSPGFHPCVYDKITFGFRSPAGPIERPRRRNAEASD